jgi:DNA-binding MurR/RpiR family transcriptional regulator
VVLPHILELTMNDSKSEKPNTLARLRSSLQSIPESERKVAEWILRDPGQVISCSMAQIANECGVSDTTVLRLCRDLGLQGFTELKISIAQDIVSPTQLIHDSISSGDDPVTIARKVFQTNVQALYDTLEMLDADSLTTAIDLIERSHRILITGVGGSMPIALWAYQRFMRVGLPVSAPTDIYLQIMEASLLGKGDLVIAVSYSGMTTDPVMVVSEAKKNGAATMVLTGNPQSKLAELADVKLLAVSHETRSDVIAARVAMSSVIDTISIIISLRHLDNTLAIDKKIVNSILPKTY